MLVKDYTSRATSEQLVGTLESLEAMIDDAKVTHKVF